MPPRPARADALLEQLFELPAEQWPERLETLCREHPSQADELRRRHDLIAATGLDREPTPPPAEIRMPERFGDFRLLRRLGCGGMGMVFVAEQVSLGREVAIKFVRPELSFSAFARERFRREIEAIAQLDHPGIVPILAHDQAGDVPYYVMPLVDGASGDDVIQRLQGRDPSRLTGADLREAIGGGGAPDSERFFDGSWWQVCVRLIRQVALALDHAHRLGIVHRDVKPSNFLFTADGRAQVVDFGLAHVPDDARITRAGVTPGSPAYMPPEQLRGGAIDARADVYSLAISLHHLLALRHPLPIDDSDTLRTAILTGCREALPAGLPPELAIVLGAAMDLDPERRHATADAFAADLLSVLEQRPILARALPRRLRVRRWMQRHPTATTAMALGALLLTATPTLVAFGVAGERDRALSAEAVASRNAYEANMSAAIGALRSGDRIEAERRLDACPEHLRGFEWRHLRQALAGSLREFPGHGAVVTAVAIRGDAAWMASADKDGRILSWQPLRDTSGAEVAAVEPRPVEAVTVSQDGRRITAVQAVAVPPEFPHAARLGPTVRVFDTATRQLVAERVSTRLGERVCVAADGDSLLVLDGLAARQLDAFTLATVRSVQLAPTGGAPAGSIAFDGDWLFAATLQSLYAWHLGDGRGSVLHDAFSVGVTSAAAAVRRGTAVFTTLGRLTIVEVEPLRVRSIDGGERDFDRVAMDAHGEFVAAVGADHAFRAWSTTTGRMTCQAFGRSATGRALAIASRRLLAVVGDDGGGLVMHGMFGTNERQLLVGHSGAISTLAPMRDGRLLSASHEPALRLWDPVTGAPTAASYAATHWINALAVPPDGSRVYVAYQQNVMSTRLPDLAVLGRVDLEHWIRHLFARGDSDVVAVLADRLVEIDMVAERVTASLPVTSGRVQAACPMHGGTHGLVATVGAIEHWQLSPSLQLCTTLPVPAASAIACSRDGTSLFTSEGSSLRRRRVDGGALVWERPCARRVTSLLLLPDDSRLVAGHDDGTVTLWEPEHCVCVATLRVGSRRVYALAADPDGSWLAASDEHAMMTLFRGGNGGEPFAARLARADAMAAIWLDDRLRADLGSQSSVLTAIAAQQQLEAGLRDAMTSAERLRPPVTWEATAEMLSTVVEPAQPAAAYERALHVAEAVLQVHDDFRLGRMVAALACLRLHRSEDVLLHCDLGMSGKINPEETAYLQAARAMALWRLDRRDDARAELERLEANLASSRPEAELERLAAEVRRLVVR